MCVCVCCSRGPLLARVWYGEQAAARVAKDKLRKVAAELQANVMRNQEVAQIKGANRAMRDESKAAAQAAAAAEKVKAKAEAKQAALEAKHAKDEAKKLAKEASKMAKQAQKEASKTFSKTAPKGFMPSASNLPAKTHPT